MIKNTKIRIRNLHCADCIQKIENNIKKMKGVLDLNISLATGQLNVKYNPEQIKITELEKRVEDLGYDIFKAEMSANKVFSFYNLRLIFIIISGLFLSLGILIVFFGFNFQIVQLGFTFYLAQFLFIISMIFGGYHILKHAFGALLEKYFAIESLMIIASIGAFLIGAYAEAAAILFLFSIAELLEEYATERSRRSINELIDLTPKTVIVRSGTRKHEVPVERVEPGDVIIVKSGAYIGIDGEVIRGNSTVNQAHITGESMPVNKVPGDIVYAGTLNQEGTLEVKATKHTRDTTLVKIIKLVEEAEENKAPTQRFMDVFSRYYTPSVLLLAVLVIIIPTYIFNQSFDIWFYKALMLILISCPCALAISTPISIVSAITNGAKKGVLFKGGAYVEKAAEIDTFAFDKTGTLTSGKPVVTDIVPLNNHSKAELLSVASSLECLSKHPLGDALVECAERKGVHNECVEIFKTIPGKGVVGTINTKTYYVGGKNFFNKEKLKGLKKYFNRFTKESKTVVVIGTKDEVLGLVAFADYIRDGSKDMVKGLRKAGIKRLVMLTGDNSKSANSIANHLEIDEYYSDLLPENKVSIIKNLSKEKGKNENGRKVAMIGDGINDSPALAAADLGIAMGAAGSDIALETADIALMKDDLSKVPYLVRLSRKTMRVVKQNIVFAISIKLLFAILVFPGLVTLWMAVAIGDMGVSLGVILNALRLGKE